MLVSMNGFNGKEVLAKKENGEEQVTQARSTINASIGEKEKEEMETSHEYASKGVAGAGLGLGM